METTLTSTSPQELTYNQFETLQKMLLSDSKEDIDLAWPILCSLEKSKQYQIIDKLTAFEYVTIINDSRPVHLRWLKKWIYDDYNNKFMLFLPSIHEPSIHEPYIYEI